MVELFLETCPLAGTIIKEAFGPHRHNLCRLEGRAHYACPGHLCLSLSVPRTRQACALNINTAREKTSHRAHQYPAKDNGISVQAAVEPLIYRAIHTSAHKLTLALHCPQRDTQTYYWNVQAQIPSPSLALWGFLMTSTLTPALAILPLVVFDSRFTSLVHPQEARHAFCGQDPAASHTPGSQTQHQTLVILVPSSHAKPAACFPLATHLKMPLWGGGRNAEG